MQQIILNPVILSLLFVVAVVFCSILVYVASQKTVPLLIEKVFIVLLLITLSAAVIFPFNFLNPRSLMLPETKFTSVTAVSQFIYYAFILFLIRLNLVYFYRGILYLLKDPFLSILLLLTILSTFWSETPMVTLRASLFFVGFMLLGSYFAIRYDFLKMEKVLRITSIFIAISGTLMSILVPAARNSDKGGAWSGILSHSNGFAFWMVLAMSLWILNAINHPQERRLSIGVIFFCLVLMILADSGTSRLMLLIMLATIATFQILKRLQPKVAYVVIVFTTSVVIFITTLVTSNTTAILGALGKEATLTGRAEFWPQILDAMARKPLLGFGYMGFWQPWREYENPARFLITPTSQFAPPNAHNGFLEVFIATGLIGITLFGLSLFLNLVKILQRSPYCRPGEPEIILMMLIPILVANTSESNLWSIDFYTFLYVFISTRLSIDLSTQNHSLLSFSSPYRSPAKT